MAKESLQFFTRYNLPKSVGVPCGDRYDILYQMKINKETGHKTLVPSGKTDRYALVQSHFEETKIENILKRATLDPTVFNQRIGQYGDFTEMPKTLAEFQQMALDMEHAFNELPVDVRKKFDNSVDKFIHDAGSKEWFEKLGNKIDPVLEKVEEVKETVTEGVTE